MNPIEQILAAELQEAEQLMKPVQTKQEDPIQRVYPLPDTVRKQKRIKRKRKQIYVAGTTDQHYDDLLNKVMQRRKKPKNYTSGENHWIPFRTRRGKSILMKGYTLKETTREISRFIVYLMVEAVGVNRWSTCTYYITHVKRMHTVNIMEKDEEPIPWPCVNKNIATPLSMLHTVAKNWFQEFYQPSGGRLPMTLGILELLHPHLNMENPIHKQVWLTLLLDRMGGFRTGELLAIALDPDKRERAKDCCMKDVIFNRNSIQISVMSKTDISNAEGRGRQLVEIPHHEIEKIVEEFGEHFNIKRLLKEHVHHKKKEDMLFTRQDGKPLTYSVFMKTLNDTCTAAKLPTGRFGGHSGRIALATVLAARGESPDEIKRRGRWKGDTYEVYVRQLNIRNKGSAVISFRIADLNLDIRNQGFPDVNEFRK